MDKQLPSIQNEPVVQEYMKILLNNDMHKEYHDMKELLDYISQMDSHIESMTNEIRELKDTIEQLKNPETKSQLSKICEKVETSVVSCQKKLGYIKTGLIDSMKKSLEDFKQKGKDAVIKVVNVAHVKEGLSSLHQSLSFSKGAVLSLSWKIDDITKELSSARTAFKNAGRILLGKPSVDKEDKSQLNFMQKGIRKIINTIDKMEHKTEKCITKINTFTKSSVKNEIKQLKENSKSKDHQIKEKEQSR
ncbi:MAG: DUF6674 family protein [Faecalibacillus sp.]